MDLSGTCRAVADTALPGATQAADKWHVVRLCNERLDEVRRRMQNETLGRRGRRDDPLYRARGLLVMADGHVTEDRQTRRRGLLKAGDPRGHVADAWTAKEAVREFFVLTDPSVADHRSTVDGSRHASGGQSNSTETLTSPQRSPVTSASTVPASVVSSSSGVSSNRDTISVAVPVRLSSRSEMMKSAS